MQCLHVCVVWAYVCMHARVCACGVNMCGMYVRVCVYVCVRMCVCVCVCVSKYPMYVSYASRYIYTHVRNSASTYTIHVYIYIDIYLRHLLRSVALVTLILAVLG